NDRCGARLNRCQELTRCGLEKDFAARPCGDDVAVRSGNDTIQWAGKVVHGYTVAGRLPDADRSMVSRANDGSAVRRKRHAVDVLAIALEDPRWSAGERPQSNGAIPRGGCQHLAIGRSRERGNRSGVAVEDPIGRLLACRPDCDMRIAACRHNAAVLEPGDRIHRPVMEAHHLLGNVARQRPANRRSIKAAGDHVQTIGRNCQRSYRSGVAAQLSVNRFEAGGAGRGDQYARKQGAARSEPRSGHSLCIITHQSSLNHGIQNGFTTLKSRRYGSMPMSLRLSSLRFSSLALAKSCFQRTKQTANKSEKRERWSGRMVMAHLRLSY